MVLTVGTFGMYCESSLESSPDSEAFGPALSLTYSVENLMSTSFGSKVVCEYSHLIFVFLGMLSTPSIRLMTLSQNEKIVI